MSETTSFLRNDIGFDLPGTRSAAAFAREKKITPGGSMRSAPWFGPSQPYAVRGEGCWIVDLEGRRILDCMNNFFSLIHGHAFPPIVAALTETAARGTAFGLPTESEIALAEEITGRSPHLAQVRFCNSGTEAVMVAIKGARGLTGRHRVAKFEGCYHGQYDHMEISLSSAPGNWDDASGNPASVPYAAGTSPSLVSETVVLPYADAAKCAAILEREGKSLAAIVVDPYASQGGMVRMEQPVLDVITRACAEHGIVLIVDEVVNYRLSHPGCSPLFGLKPDFVTLGKIIGGGLPVGAVAGTVEAMAVFDHVSGKPRVAQGGTFSCNPMTMAAGLASLTCFDAAAVARLNRLGDSLRGAVNAAMEGKGIPAMLVGTGSLFRLHLSAVPAKDYRSARPSPAQAKAISAIHDAMLSRGVLLSPNCSGALSTPMTEAEIGLLGELLVDSIAGADSWLG